MIYKIFTTICALVFLHLYIEQKDANQVCFDNFEKSVVIAKRYEVLTDRLIEGLK